MSGLKLQRFEPRPTHFKFDAVKAPTLFISILKYVFSSLTASHQYISFNSSSASHILPQCGIKFYLVYSVPLTLRKA